MRQVTLADLAAKGWQTMEDVAPSADLDASKPIYRSFLLAREIKIPGREMRKRAVAMKANLGFADGQRLLAEQDKIPPELREFYIPLPGTLLRHEPSQSLYIVSLFFDGRLWKYYFDWLGLPWGRRGRFACAV